MKNKEKDLQLDHQNNYIEKIKVLRKNILHINDHSNTFIKGDIKIDADGLLFLSIPYDIGWSIKVNGEKREIHKVNIGFMGVFLKRGFHEIELEYSMPFLKTGLVISIIGLLIYLLLILKYQLRKRTNER